MSGSHNFKEETGEMSFDGSGYLRVNVAAGGAGDGAILDGVSSSIKATVFDYTSSNPLAVVLRDTNGDYVSVGGGTQYTEDAASAADPVGTAVNLIRKDTPATITSTDGDNIAQRGTNYGAAYVQVVTSGGTYVDTFGGGTQYTEDAAAASDPVGTQLISRRRDTLSSEVSADGDVIAVNATAKGELYTAEQDFVSTNNSSTATLGSDGVFTGTAEDIRDYRAITVNVISNVASATNGLSLQWSSDNTNWDHSETYTVAAATGFSVQASCRARYFRVVYTNGGSAQASFRLQTILRRSDISPRKTRLGEVPSLQDPGILTQSVITGETTAGGGALVNVKVSPAGSVQVGGTVGLDAGTNNIGDVDVLTVPAPLNVTGGGVEASALRVTIASDSTGVLSVDDNGGSLTVDGTVAVTGVSTLAEQQTQTASLQLLDDTVFAEDVAHNTADKGIQSLLVRRDTASALGADNDYTPGTTNARAAQWVAIEDGAGGQITSFGGGTQYTEDAAAAANPVGTASILVRTDTPATQVDTDGDNIAQRGTNYGAAYVQLVTSAGAYIDSVGGGTEYTEDVATANPIVGKAIMIERDDVLSAVTPIEGDNIGLRGTAEGALWTQDFNSDAILADTTAIKTAVEILDNAISGNEMQVDVLTMPTVTVTATNLDVQSGGADLATTTQAGAIQTAVEIIDNAIHVDDAAFTLGTHSGVMMMGFAGTQSVNANDAGAIAMETDGAIHIHDGGNTITVDGTVAVTGVSTLAEQQTQTTHLSTIAGDTTSIQTSVELIDDTVAVLGTATYLEATTKGLVIGAVRRDADTTLVDTTNEITALQVDANGYLKVEIFDGGGSHTVDAAAGGLIIGDGTNPIVMLTDGADNVSNANNQLIVAGMTYAYDGTTWDRVTNGGGTEATAMRVTIASDSTGVLSVDDNAGSLTVDAPVGTPVNVQIGNASISAGVIDETGAAAVDALAVGGGTAHDAVDSGNPVKVGGVAVSGSASPTSVAAADRTRWIFNQHGIPYTMAGHPNLITREYDFGTAAQTDVNLAGALVAADERVYVTRFEAMVDNATTVDVSVRAGFGAASVPTASATGVSGMIGSHPGVAPGSGFICGSGAGVIAVGAAGEEPRLTSSAATTGNLHVIISYYLIDETP